MNTYATLYDADGLPRDDAIQLTRPSGVVSEVPNDAANADWQDYQAWLAAGNSPRA